MFLRCLARAFTRPFAFTFLCLALLSFASISHAADAATPPLHPWVVPPPLLVKEAYFSNLQDGAAIETPFLLKFGLTGMGLATITGPLAKTGHHHLLVNRELPLDFTQPLPFDDQYIHFGKGQMETVLTFEPGTYTLRLVLADNKHIPNFVYSKPIRITVTKKHDDIDARSLVKKGVEMLAPRPGEVLKPPFRIAFHASGFNVSNQAMPDKGTGHFRLKIGAEGTRDEVIDFGNGHTETWLNPPPGKYIARLELIDNNAPDQALAASVPLAFRVEP